MLRLFLLSVSVRVFVGPSVFSPFLLLFFFIVVFYVCLFVCPSVVLCLCSSMFVCLPSTLRSVSTAWATGARVGTHSPRSGHRGYAL